jgi:farnesyl-diphosphate farnesyltransferase
MTSEDVNRDLLRSVSRTFYLSVRILPEALRETMGVAYLLARASDTIADCEGVPAATRLRRLTDFGAMVGGGLNSQTVGIIQRDIQPQHEGERTLIASLPQVLERFGAFKAWEWKETQELLSNIIRGQSNDLRTFPESDHVNALPDADSLEDYIYLVAGCVGEWWTRVAFHHYDSYSSKSEDDLMPLASGFGKGLQLVNILRDIRADLRDGRCYLPEDELRAAGADPADLREAPSDAEPVYNAWRAKARTYLEQGREYIRAIRPGRIRIACYLPWRLAGQTLDLMETTSPLRLTRTVKVTRSDVYGAMFRSLFAAVSNQPLA